MKTVTSKVKLWNFRTEAIKESGDIRCCSLFSLYYCTGYFRYGVRNLD